MEVSKLINNDPTVRGIAECREVFWVNSNVSSERDDNIADIDEAEARLLRFVPFIKRIEILFPEMVREKTADVIQRRIGICKFFSV